MGRNADHLPAFFAVYNMETTDIVAFYQVNGCDFVICGKLLLLIN